MKSLYSLFILIIAFSSCTYDKEEKNKMVVLACDTNNVRFSAEIKSVLEANCLSCHGGNAEGGAGIQLNNYDEIKSYVDQNRFLESMTRTGSDYMPRGGDRLSDSKIEQIRCWIKKGAPNN